jgi:transposase
MSSGPDHEHETERELEECPECGAELDGEESVEKEPVESVRSAGPTIHIGRRQGDLWLCKGCGAILGVKLDRD